MTRPQRGWEIRDAATARASRGAWSPERPDRGTSRAGSRAGGATQPAGAGQRGGLVDSGSRAAGRPARESPQDPRHAGDARDARDTRDTRGGSPAARPAAARTESDGPRRNGGADVGRIEGRPGTGDSRPRTPQRESRGPAAAGGRPSGAAGRSASSGAARPASAYGAGRASGPGGGGRREELADRTYDPRREARRQLLRVPVPPGVDPRDLDPEVRQELRSLAKDTADLTAQHLVLTGRLLDDDPEAALAHARAAGALAGRVGPVREAVGLAAYAAGEWAEALSELRAARRLTGRADHLAVLADCERALGRPERALAVLQDPDVPKLEQAGRVELVIVVAGARRDLWQADAAVLLLQSPARATTARRPWATRLWYAYADALLAAGRDDEAREWFAKAAEQDGQGETDAMDRLLELDGVVLEDLQAGEDDDEDGGEDEEPEAVDLTALLADVRVDGGRAGQAPDPEPVTDAVPAGAPEAGTAAERAGAPEGGTAAEPATDASPTAEQVRTTPPQQGGAAQHAEPGGASHEAAAPVPADAPLWTPEPLFSDERPVTAAERARAQVPAVSFAPPPDVAGPDDDADLDQDGDGHRSG